MKKKYCVDVHWDVAKVYEVEANSPEEAEMKINKMIENGDVCVWTDGFSATDDVEVNTSGEVNENGEREYY